MRLAILNPLILRTLKVGCETSEKKSNFLRAFFFEKKRFFRRDNFTRRLKKGFFEKVAL
jgi:hypothetical protein